MKLFYSANSPFARKARVVAIEKGVIDRIECVAVNPLENPPELLAVNPLAKIPALVTGEGLALCESPVICEYLDALAPEPSLYPEAAPRRWRVLSVAALADGILDAAVAMVLEGRRPEEKRWDVWKARQQAAIERTAALLDRDPILEEEELTIGAINLACALGYLDFRHPGIDWRAGSPKLAAWYRRFAARNSMQATRPGE